jgi:2-keto-4-pentenoate hydratase
MKLEFTAMMLFLCVLLPAVHAGGGPDIDPERVARAYLDARKAGLSFPEVFGNGEQHSDALLYEVQRKLVELQLDEGLTIGGYKGGFIPKASIGGVLFAEGVLKGRPILKRTDFQNLLVEAEIAFQFCAAIKLPVADVAALKALTCNVYPAIELPDAAVRNLDGLLRDLPQLRRALIPTNMAVANVLLGEGKNPNSLDLDHLTIRATHNDVEIGNRDGSTSNDDIWSRVLWIVNEFVLARGYELSAEHIIIPGALTGLHQSTPGHYKVDYGALGEVEFRIEP